MSAQQQTAMFAVMGMIDEASTQAVEAAVLRADPDASVTVYLLQGLAQITSRATPDKLIAAIEAAGFAAEMSTRTPPAAPAFTPRAVGRSLGRAALWALAWSLLLPLIMLIAVGTIAFFDPQCGGPGDSGGCAMGIFSVTISAVPVGAVLGFAVTLARGLWKIHRARSVPRLGAYS